MMYYIEHSRPNTVWRVSDGTFRPITFSRGRWHIETQGTVRTWKLRAVDVLVPTLYLLLRGIPG